MYNMSQAFIDKVSSVPDTPRKEDVPNVDMRRELSSIHRHLVLNRKKILANMPQSESVQGLGDVLDELDARAERAGL